MLRRELERICFLSVKDGRGDANPDEQGELKHLRERLLENGGINSASAGLVIGSNFSWLYKPYEVLIEQGQLAASDELERDLYWSCINVLEGHVKANAMPELLKRGGGQEYYRLLSSYFRSNRISEDTNKVSLWRDEPTVAKWMLLKGKLKSTIAERLRLHLESEKPVIGNRIEDRVEPLFNKIVKQLNAEVDLDSLNTGEKIKILDKLSGLLADMKGERKTPDAVQVTHNNVFNVIMENKKESKQLARAAVELREGEGYELI